MVREDRGGSCCSNPGRKGPCPELRVAAGMGEDGHTEPPRGRRPGWCPVDVGSERH